MALPAKERFSDVLEKHIEVQMKNNFFTNNITYKKTQLICLGALTDDEKCNIGAFPLVNLPQNSVDAKSYLYTDAKGNLYNAYIYTTDDGKSYLAAIKSIPEK
ncbi:MAG TPA: hypothetical protein PKK61_09975 [Defluviitaleaceae bacterium]|nr:hypothetical protein [Defluviitaleaceae bacterium]